MKKYVKKLIIVSVILLQLTILSGCGTKISMAEFMDSFVAAIKNTIASDIYFWQENNIIEGKYREVNLIADIDNQGLPLTCDSDKFKNYRLRIVEQIDGVLQKDIYVGKSVSNNDKNLSKDYLVGEKREGDIMVQYSKPMRTQDYIVSEDYAQLRPQEVIKELLNLREEDFNTSIKQFSVEKKFNLIKLNVGINHQYQDHYAALNKKNSIFADSTYIYIEIAYNRITQLVIYRAQNYGTFVVDSEAYNFKIAYVGPKFTVPSWDR